MKLENGVSIVITADILHSTDHATALHQPNIHILLKASVKSKKKVLIWLNKLIALITYLSVLSVN
jgi:hypothetical protein